MRKELADKIQAALKARKKSKREASEGAGLSHGTLSYLLKEEDRNPDPETAIKLARYFGFDEDETLRLAGYRPTAKAVATMTPAELRDLMSEPVAVVEWDDLAHRGMTARSFAYVRQEEQRGKDLRGAYAPDALDESVSLVAPGDLVLVDLDGTPSPGGLVVIVSEGRVRLSRYEDVSREAIVGVVIEVRKKLRP